MALPSSAPPKYESKSDRSMPPRARKLSQRSPGDAETTLSILASPEMHFLGEVS